MPLFDLLGILFLAVLFIVVRIMMGAMGPT